MALLRYYALKREVILSSIQRVWEGVIVNSWNIYCTIENKWKKARKVEIQSVFVRGRERESEKGCRSNKSIINFYISV